MVTGPKVTVYQTWVPPAWESGQPVTVRYHADIWVSFAYAINWN